MTRFELRRNKLARAIRSEGAEAILITNAKNVTYLTGFTGGDAFLLVGRGVAVLISDPRYAQQLEEECPGLELAIRRPTVSVIAMAASVVKDAKVHALALEAASVTLSQFDQLDTLLPKITLVPTTGQVERQREIKDGDELRAIREAVRLAEQAFAVIRAALRPEQTEREIAFSLEHQIRLSGGAGCAFPPIVAVGPRAALPHAFPTERLVGEGNALLVDWGASATLLQRLDARAGDR